MLKDYDESFTNKIKAWYTNTIYANTAVVYNVAYNLVDDNVFEGALKFPLISIYRTNGFTIQPNQNFAARRRGLLLHQDSVSKEYTMARFIVVNLPYQLDIYSKTPEALDDITEQIIQALNLDQKLLVIQKDGNSGQEHSESYDITYDSGPSELSEFQDGDRIYHYSLLYNIKGARLLNFKVTPGIESSEATVDVEDSDPNNL